MKIVSAQQKNPPIRNQRFLAYHCMLLVYLSLSPQAHSQTARRSYVELGELLSVLECPRDFTSIVDATSQSSSAHKGVDEGTHSCAVTDPPPLRDGIPGHAARELPP